MIKGSIQQEDIKFVNTSTKHRSTWIHRAKNNRHKVRNWQYHIIVCYNSMHFSAPIIRLIVREIQIKTTMTYHLTPVKKTTNNNQRWGVKENKSYEVKYVGFYGAAWKSKLFV